ncbi:hypothetical protein D9M68_1004220 [compost metagenome]
MKRSGPAMSSITPSSRISSPGISGMKAKGLKAMAKFSSPGSTSNWTGRVVSPVRSTNVPCRLRMKVISQQ